MYKAPPFAAHYNAKEIKNVGFSVIIKGLSKNVNDSSFQESSRQKARTPSFLMTFSLLIA